MSVGAILAPSAIATDAGIRHWAWENTTCDSPEIPAFARDPA
jgi:hypothetical protein